MLITIPQLTFPSKGAIPIITDASAARTCCDESVDSSCKFLTITRTKYVGLRTDICEIADISPQYVDGD